MADEDPAAARAALAAEAARLKAKRLGTKEDEAAALAERKAAYERSLHSVTAASLRKALSRPAFFWIGGFILVMAAVAFAIPGNDRDPDAVDPRDARLFGLVAGLIGSFGILHHYSAVARARFWLKRLPFEVQGFDETLGYGMAHGRVELVLSFKDTPAKAELLKDLVEARLGEGSTVNGTTLVRSGLSIESANYPAAGWFRKAVKRVVLDVHRAYPIARVHLIGKEQSTFYYGSGD